MTDFSQVHASPGGLGAGIKVAALVFTLGAIALAADLAWLAPAQDSVRDGARELPVKYETIGGTRYPAPSAPAGAEPEAHIQAF